MDEAIFISKRLDRDFRFPFSKVLPKRKKCLELNWEENATSTFISREYHVFSWGCGDKRRKWHEIKEVIFFSIAELHDYTF